eukprot:scaffold7542_cov113-Cylindrotheca_fusiformis.AAC.8
MLATFAWDYVGKSGQHDSQDVEKSMSKTQHWDYPDKIFITTQERIMQGTVPHLRIVHCCNQRHHQSDRQDPCRFDSHTGRPWVYILLLPLITMRERDGRQQRTNILANHQTKKYTNLGDYCCGFSIILRVIIGGVALGMINMRER